MTQAGIKAIHIPQELKDRKQWIVWKRVLRDGKETKVPCRTDGKTARSNEPSDWASFGEAWNVHRRFTGIGFVFSPDDPYVGIDLDGCRNPKTGEIAAWARAILDRLQSYSEVSPSATGVKVWCKGKLPDGRGLKTDKLSEPSVCEKQPGIEVYSQGRYFAVTGWRLPEYPPDIREANLDWLLERYFATPQVQPTASAEPSCRNGPLPLLERARRYVAKMPPAISGQRGHDTTYHVACVLVKGFGLSEADAMTVMREYNVRCVPPWTEKELLHKAQDAAKEDGPVGYLAVREDENYQGVTIPKYGSQRESASTQPKQPLLLRDAAFQVVEQCLQEEKPLLSTGLGSLDEALGGGLDFGEVVIVAGRPGHGKTAFALQLAHCVARKWPVLVVSEEMSARAIAKRTVQFVTDVPMEYWPIRVTEVRKHLEEHFDAIQPIYLVESCGTASQAVSTMRAACEQQGVRGVVVDYAQLLRSKGNNRYEEITRTSIALREATTELNILLILVCQLSREVDHRETFQPTMRDLRDSGQLEQDADVILFVCWPWRLEESRPPSEYQVIIAKNRHRPIQRRGVKLEFNPARQMLSDGGDEYFPAEEFMPYAE